MKSGRLADAIGSGISISDDTVAETVMWSVDNREKLFVAGVDGTAFVIRAYKESEALEAIYDYCLEKWGQDERGNDAFSIDAIIELDLSEEICEYRQFYTTDEIAHDFNGFFRLTSQIDAEDEAYVDTRDHIGRLSPAALKTMLSGFDAGDMKVLSRDPEYSVQFTVFDRREPAMTILLRPDNSKGYIGDSDFADLVTAALN